MRAFKDLMRSSGVDIVMPDLGKAEGITGGKRIVDFAPAEGVGYTPHSWSTAINTAAAAHLYASSTNGMVFELKPNASPIQAELVAEPFQQREGRVDLPTGPGLGVEVDQKVVERYDFRRVSMEAIAPVPLRLWPGQEVQMRRQDSAAVRAGHGASCRD